MLTIAKSLFNAGIILITVLMLYYFLVPKRRKELGEWMRSDSRSARAYRGCLPVVFVLACLHMVVQLCRVLWKLFGTE